MRYKYRQLLLGTLGTPLVFSCACATLASPTSVQRVVVSSDPPGAQVLVNGQPSGVTPVAVELSRRDGSAAVRLEKDGFVPEEHPVHRSLSRWLLADVAFAAVSGSVPGGGDAGAPSARIALGLLWTLGLEYLTGAAFRLPESINAKLKPARRVAGMRRETECTNTVYDCREDKVTLRSLRGKYASKWLFAPSMARLPVWISSRNLEEQRALPAAAVGHASRRMSGCSAVGAKSSGASGGKPRRPAARCSR